MGSLSIEQIADLRRFSHRLPAHGPDRPRFSGERNRHSTFDGG
jgi:hypothetical protein